MLEQLREIEPDIRAPHVRCATQATMVLAGAATTIVHAAAATTVAGARALRRQVIGSATRDRTRHRRRRRRRHHGARARPPTAASGAATGSSRSCCCSPVSPRAPAGTSAPAPARSPPFPTIGDAAPRRRDGRSSKTAGFVVADADDANDPVVAAGPGRGHRPAVGEQARAASRSRSASPLGPQILAVPDVIGSPEADARTRSRRLRGRRAAASSSSRPTSPPASVIAVLDADGDPRSAASTPSGGADHARRLGRPGSGCRRPDRRRGRGGAHGRRPHRSTRDRPDVQRRRADGRASSRPTPAAPRSRATGRHDRARPSRRAPTSSSVPNVSPARPSPQARAAARGARVHGRRRTCPPSSTEPSWRRCRARRPARS